MATPKDSVLKASLDRFVLVSKFLLIIFIIKYSRHIKFMFIISLMIMINKLIKILSFQLNSNDKLKRLQSCLDSEGYAIVLNESMKNFINTVNQINFY